MTPPALDRLVRRVPAQGSRGSFAERARRQIATGVDRRGRVAGGSAESRRAPSPGARTPRLGDRRRARAGRRPAGARSRDEHPPRRSRDAHDDRCGARDASGNHRRRFRPAGDFPDGTMLVFSALGGGAGKRLWLRRLDELVAHPLPGTEEASYPFWSPDSRSIGFFSPARIKRIDLAQGSVTTVTDSIDASRGGTWSRDGVILYTPTFTSGLYQVPASGGPRHEVTKLDSTFETTQRFPLLPARRKALSLSVRQSRRRRMATPRRFSTRRSTDTTSAACSRARAARFTPTGSSSSFATAR